MISIAIKDDASQIFTITQNTGVFNKQEIDCVTELWNEYQQKGPEASGYYFIVARKDKRVLGFACYGPHPLTQDTYDLYWIAVNPAYRRDGIGRELLKQVEYFIRSQGGQLVIVETSGQQIYESARAFYEAEGYLKEATLHDFYQKGNDLIFYTKHLK